MKPILVFGADHAGFALKQALIAVAKRRGYQTQDASPIFVAGDDYPPVAQQVAAIIRQQPSHLGVLICGSGLGMDIAANRQRGIRAAVVRDAAEAQRSRQHNHANILVLGSAFTSVTKARRLLTIWLATRPSNAVRHRRRVQELDAP